MPTVVQIPEDAPLFVLDWVAQLTSPDTIAMLKANSDRRIDLVLFAHRGRASRPCQATITATAGLPT